jgi:CheY-like chemotaxis protein
VRLPAELPERAIATEEPRRAERIGAPEAAATVLVIDDDPTARNLMERFLAREGYRVVSAAGGEEGLRLARENRPDAITLDILMPGMDGWAVLSTLKADPQLADVPVILVTIIDDQNLGFALGASEYLNKPVDRERLAAVLRKYAPGRSPGPVLVVEDDAATRNLLCRMIEKAGWPVAEAENGRVALERVAEAVPSLILLDLMMPVMDGFAFIGELRRRGAWRSIPVVVVTAKELTGEARALLDGCVERVIEKGAYSREELLAEVRELVAARLRSGERDRDGKA